MLLDEKLLQIEQEKAQKEVKENRIREIREEFLKQEREQKSIQEWMEELKKGKVTIDENEFLCEKIKLFDENIPLYVFSEDIVKIIQENHLAIVSYRELELGMNLTFLRGSLCVENEIVFQQKLSEQYNVSYEYDYYEKLSDLQKKYLEEYIQAGLVKIKTLT